MFYPSCHKHGLILLYLTLAFSLFHIQMFFDLLKIFFDLLSTRQSTLEAQKRLYAKQPQAELKKRVCL